MIHHWTDKNVYKNKYIYKYLHMYHGGYTHLRAQCSL